MFPEYRQHRRHSCRVHFIAASRSVVTGEVRDLSASGLCLVTDSTFARGTALHLEFQLETGKVEAMGEVRRVVDSENGLNLVGVRFLRIPNQSLDAIKTMTAPSWKKSGNVRGTVGSFGQALSAQ